MAEPGADPEDKAPGFSSRASTPGRLSLDVLVSYSLPSVGFGFTGLLFVIYLMKFSTDVLLIVPISRRIRRPLK